MEIEGKVKLAAVNAGTESSFVEVSLRGGDRSGTVSGMVRARGCQNVVRRVCRDAERAMQAKCG